MRMHSSMLRFIPGFPPRIEHPLLAAPAVVPSFAIDPSTFALFRAVGVPAGPMRPSCLRETCSHAGNGAARRAVRSQAPPLAVG